MAANRSREEFHRAAPPGVGRSPRPGEAAVEDVATDWCEGLAAESGYRVVAGAAEPGKAPRFAPAPECLALPVREQLAETYAAGIYEHQARALEAFVGGRDVCLATSTASGKSLVFMAGASHLLLRDRHAVVLALYPAKALIQDQIRKWTDQLRPFGIGFGYIDGGVPIAARNEILRRNRVVLMTPDVCHAWLLSSLAERDVARFLDSLRLLILDETHVYEGVFGTNMAYLLRRLQVASGLGQIVCSTATLGRPSDFLQQLTGREFVTFGPEDDGTGSPRKEIRVLQCVSGKPFDSIVTLLVALARGDHGKFLAFADSRRMVEQVVAAIHRSARPRGEDDEGDGHEEAPPSEQQILPYRAGYEEVDRKLIQDALNEGRLAGVVSTSALELGIDIGDLETIVLLGPPPSVKAFRQRLGRVGRSRPGTCLVIDDKGLVANTPERLEAYLRRLPEPSWLYLENRYLQYANALCATVELEGRADRCDLGPFASLPSGFRDFLDNERNPREIVADDLYVLKQRGQGGPHREFPIRSGVEKEFSVKTPDGQALGRLTFSQALREAYPGAIYHYMARPYRVFRFDYRMGQIITKREKHWTTRPSSQTMVFPRFRDGAMTLLRSDVGFLAEAQMQVSERVLGFTERRGGAPPENHSYGPHSIYYRRSLDRFFQTSGVCWHFPDKVVTTEAIGRVVLEAFCARFSVQERDLGVGVFHAKETPLGLKSCQGICVFDAAAGSLRLTQRLAEHFPEVLETALLLASKDEDSELDAGLRQLAARIGALHRAELTAGPSVPQPRDEQWAHLIAPGSKAIYLSEDGSSEVEVQAYRYTPQGMMYELATDKPGTRWLVRAGNVHPLHGESRMLRYNLMTGEVEALG